MFQIWQQKTFWQSQSQMSHQGDTKTPQPAQYFIGQVHIDRSSLKSRSHHIISHLDPPISVPIRDQLSTLPTSIVSEI